MVTVELLWLLIFLPSHLVMRILTTHLNMLTGRKILKPKRVEISSALIIMLLSFRRRLILLEMRLLSLRQSWLRSLNRTEVVEECSLSWRSHSSILIDTKSFYHSWVSCSNKSTFTSRRSKNSRIKSTTMKKRYKTSGLKYFRWKISINKWFDNGEWIARTRLSKNNKYKLKLKQ